MEETGVSAYKLHSDDAIKSFVSERLNDTVIVIVYDVDAEEPCEACAEVMEFLSGSLDCRR